MCSTLTDQIDLLRVLKKKSCNNNQLNSRTVEVKLLRKNQEAMLKYTAESKNTENLMSILRWNDIGINVDVGPGEKLAKGHELVVGVKTFGLLLPQL